MEQSSRVVITVPLYCSKLSELELISISRCVELWAERYDIVVLTPEGVDHSKLLKKYPVISLRLVARDAMLSISHYNRLLLSREFYELFDDYDYMLIYQADCFVFRDGLSEWVGKGYDYVGAPWHTTRCLVKRGVGYLLRTFRLYHTPWFMYNQVGNGGFSLRRISAFLAHFDGKPKQSRRARRGRLNEDVYWSMEASELSKPSSIEASHFCADMTPRRFPDDVLAVHGWNKDSRTLNFWASMIQKSGYSID